jgi:hypothetical protein
MKCFFLHAQQADLAKLLPLLTFAHGEHLPITANRQAVIVWGGSAVLDQIIEPKHQYLNDQQSILNAKIKKTMNNTLVLHGLKVKPWKDNPVFRIEFQIPVFHLKALTVFSKKSSTKLWSTMPFYESSADRFEELDLNSRVGHHVRRAVREARKAVYALGLDFALVHIGILGVGDTIVMDVDPTPSLNQRLAECYAEAMNLFAEEQDGSIQQTLSVPRRILIGADPEFILRSPNGKIVSADRYMEREGVVGCDAVVLSGHRVLLPLVELRPQPSTSPLALTHRLRNLMQQAAKMINDPKLEWLAGAMPVKGLPLGGHIHFSGVDISSRLLRVLDNYLALPLLLLEDETVHRRRPRYGFLGDFRLQSHGGFEYRALPSWLVSPEVTVGVLSLAYIIAHHYLELNQRPLHQIEVQRAFYQGDKNVIEPLAEILWKDIKQTAMYDRYHAQLNALYQMIVQRQAWREQQDFRSNWRISPILVTGNN